MKSKDATEFMKLLQSINLTNVFNPYTDHCKERDVPGAEKIRSQLLWRILNEAMQSDLDSIWVGRDLGYRGGRRTGLALTDELHVSDYLLRWGIEEDLQLQKREVKERTASVIWSMLNSIHSPIFLWNVFPFHPFHENMQFTNRCHNASERRKGEEILDHLINLLNPSKLIAIGNDAADSLARINCKANVYKVRHPSYGGHIDFCKQISAIYTSKEANC